MTNSEIVNKCGDRVWSSINGQGRGDGYDVEAYVLGSRFLVRVYEISGGYSLWYVADSLADAKAVGALGYSPGGAPGKYRYVRNPARLLELRA